MNILPINRTGGLPENKMQEQLIKALIIKKYYLTAGDWNGINAKIYTEVSIPNIGRRSDVIVLITPSRIVNIECKMDNYIQVLEQAKDYLIWADYSYICIHHSTYVPNYILHSMIKKGIGLIYWIAGEDFVEVIQGMKNRKADKNIRKIVIERLNKLQHKLRGVEESEKQGYLIFHDTK